MIIRRQSMISGKYHELDIDVTQDMIDNWKKGMLIQDAMPNLTGGEREFIMTGITEQEWDDTFKEEFDNDDDE